MVLDKVHGWNRKTARLRRVATGLVAVSLLSACSAGLGSYGPSLVGEKPGEDSIWEEDNLFSRKKTYERQNLPVPLVTGARAGLAGVSPQDPVIQLILDDLKHKSEKQ